MNHPLTRSIQRCSFLLLLHLAVVACKKDDPTPPAPVIPTPTITALSPDNGEVGTAVTITGTNFSTTATQNAVLFNGKSATVVSANATSMVAQVPEGAGTGPVTVTTSGKTGTSATPFTYKLTIFTSLLAGSGGVFRAGQGIAASVGFPLNLFSSPADENLYYWDHEMSEYIGTIHVGTLRKITTDGTVSDVQPRIKSAYQGADGTTYTISTLGFSPTGKAYCALSAVSADKLTATGRIGFFEAGSLKLLSNTATGFQVPFTDITGFLVSSDTEFYVIGPTSAGGKNRKLYKLTGSGYTLLAGNTNPNDAGQDGQGAGATFSNKGSSNYYYSSSNSMVADAAGNLLVYDWGSLRKVTPDGTVTTFVGKMGNFVVDASGKTNITNESGTAAVLGAISYMNIGSDGTLYLTDLNGKFYRMVSPSGAVTTPYSTEVAQRSYPLKGNFYSANNYLGGVIADKQGNQYVAGYSYATATGTTREIWKFTLR